MIFLSYVSEDRPRVTPFYELLEAHNLAPWMDCKSILGGQSWDYEIMTALERSDIIVIFVSENSIDKRGYAQKEISFAIEKTREKVARDIYVIPIQLDPVDFPAALKGIQFIQTEGRSRSDVEHELLRSIEAAQRGAKEKVSEAQSKAEVRWHLEESKSAYNGIPGYSTTIQRISLSSTKYAHIRDIEDHINGTLAGYSMSSRRAALTPEPSLYNLMQSEWKRTDTFDAIFQAAQVVGRVLSVEYGLHWYSAGAAHPVHSPKSFSYLLEPVVHLGEFKGLFSDERALQAVQVEVQSSLMAELNQPAPSPADIDWIRRGTQAWDDFGNFTFTEDGLVVSFASYQVACYAAGMPKAKVPYRSVVEYLTDDVLYALGLHRATS
ncbi:TIR domain-containing protein [Cereibacter sphaeroides]|nr:TIR domain-containing protein [Cereibacter sphaeroides]